MKSSKRLLAYNIIATVLLCSSLPSWAQGAGQNPLPEMAGGGTANIYVANASNEIGRLLIDYSASVQQANFQAPVGVQKLIQDSLVILNGRNQNNALLVGDPRGGKTSVAMGLAQELTRQGIRTLGLDVMALKFVPADQVDNVVRQVADYVKSQNAVLIIDNIHELTGDLKTNPSASTLLNVLKAHLADANLRVFATTNYTDFRQSIQADLSLKNLFTELYIDRPSAADALNILRSQKTQIQSYHGVLIPDATLEATIKYMTRYMGNEPLVSGALELLDRAAAELSLRRKGMSEGMAELAADVESKKNLIASLRSDLDNARLLLLPEELVKEYEVKLAQAEADLKASEQSARTLSTVADANHELAQIEKRLVELSNTSEETRRTGLLGMDKRPSTNIEVQELNDRKTAILGEIRGSLAASGVPAFVDGRAIAQWVSIRSRIDLDVILGDDRSRLERLKVELPARVIGNGQAIQAVVEALEVRYADVRPTSGPIGAQLFDGPSGVGKTLISKQLASIMGMEFIQISMAEYQSKADVWKLIGSTTGYVGADKGGILTEHVVRNPFSVVLLDEIEKAHPDVLKLFLQALDEGKMTDGQGRTVDFRNTILIMTSNASATYLATTPGSAERLQYEKALLEPMVGGEEEFKKLTAEDRQTRTLAELRLRSGLVTELLGRLNVITFERLTPEQAMKVAETELKIQGDYVEKTHGLKLEFTRSFIQSAAVYGYDATYGARSLREWYKAHVDLVLADIINGRHAAVGETIRFDQAYEFHPTDKENLKVMKVFYPVEIGAKRIANVTQAFNEFTVLHDVARSYGAVGEAEKAPTVEQRAIEAGKQIIRIR